MPMGTKILLLMLLLVMDSGITEGPQTPCYGGGGDDNLGHLVTVLYLVQQYIRGPHFFVMPLVMD